MDIEFEIKVLDIDVANTVKLLKKLGFNKQELLEYKRYIYPVKSKGQSWLRLRTGNEKTTLALKQYNADTVDGVKELEIIVSDFEKTNLLLKSLGHKNDSYQENRRTVFLCDQYNAEISIDEWPYIPAYLEIEGKDSDIVKKLLKKINTNNLPVTSMPTADIYRHYGLKLEKYKILAFQHNP